MSARYRPPSVAILIAAALGVHPGAPAAALPHFQVVVLDTCVNYSAGLEDPRFTVTVCHEDAGGPWIRSVVSDTPYTVGERRDLVPALEEALQSTSGDEYLLAQCLARLILPHVDDPAAAAFYLRSDIPLYVPEDWPKPEDASFPPVWLSHLDQEEVLKELAAAVARADTTGNARALLDVLVSTNSEGALSILQDYLERHAATRALVVGDLLPCGRVPGYLPMAKRPWQYLLTQVLPTYCSQPVVSEDWIDLIWFWWHFCTDVCDPEETAAMIDGFSWDEVNPLAESYLHELLRSPDFVRLMAGMGQAAIPDSVSATRLLYECDSFEVLLQVCARFGTRTQVADLERVLAPYDEMMSDPEFASLWRRGLRRRGRFPAPPRPRFEECQATYDNLRAATLAEMKQRSSSRER